MLINMGYLLQELFERYEICVNGEWQPFGVIEDDKEQGIIMIKEFKTHTGVIFCDTDKTMEYLYVGDYGKENNIKADFLGFTKEINSVISE